MNEGVPPVFFHAVFEFHSERTVVPCVSQTAVDLGSWEDKTPALAERHNLVERGCWHRKGE